MIFLGLVLVAAGTAVGAVTGGRFGRLAALEIPRLWLVVAAVLAQPLVRAVTGRADSVASRVALLVGLGLAGWWLVLALRGSLLRGVRIGFGLVALGWALNAVVIGVNGRMPVRAGATATTVVEAGPGALVDRHVASGHGTHLQVLGDVITIGGAAFSLGDLALALGVATVVAAGMHTRPTTTAAGEDLPRSLAP